MMESMIVGREKEKATFSRCLEKVMESNGQTILINGEASIGKSTLWLITLELMLNPRA